MMNLLYKIIFRIINKYKFTPLDDGYKLQLKIKSGDILITTSKMDKWYILLLHSTNKDIPDNWEYIDSVELEGDPNRFRILFLGNKIYKKNIKKLLNK